MEDQKWLAVKRLRRTALGTAEELHRDILCHRSVEDTGGHVSCATSTEADHTEVDTLNLSQMVLHPILIKGAIRTQSS